MKTVRKRNLPVNEIRRFLEPGPIVLVRSRRASELPFVEEALRWLPGEVQNAIIDDALPADQSALPDAERPLILLADDNADMRE
jgi:hypothetical protein